VYLLRLLTLFPIWKIPLVLLPAAAPKKLAGLETATPLAVAVHVA
jgi:hypothetical protein